MNHPSFQHSRRDFLYGLGMSLGSVAFSDLLARDAQAGPLSLKKPHLPAKAKAFTTAS